MIPLSKNDHELLRRVREHFRLCVTFGSPTQMDAILELLHEDAMRNDPEWERPEDTMGEKPRAIVLEAMKVSLGDERDAKSEPWG